MDAYDTEHLKKYKATHYGGNHTKPDPGWCMGCFLFDRITELEAEVDTLTQQEESWDSQLCTMRKALEFYGDPVTYFAIGFFPDPPCGEFMKDFEQLDIGNKPGKRARDAVMRIGPCKHEAEVKWLKDELGAEENASKHLKADNESLRGALERLVNEFYDPKGRPYCGWCGNSNDDWDRLAHDDDCIVQPGIKALTTLRDTEVK